MSDIALHDEPFRSTQPKPFIFVLMPFSKAFDDVYKFGIQGAANDVGAYASRVDEELFSEGILDRIFNQIAKADVLVADMTGRNANVFYEVGYAHGLGKIVVLITQSADDIPFDLKHRQHILYEGSIAALQPRLARSLEFALREASQRKRISAADAIGVLLRPSFGKPRESDAPPVPLILNKTTQTRHRYAGEGRPGFMELRFIIGNQSSSPVGPVSHVFLLCPDNTSPRTEKRKFGATGRRVEVDGVVLLEYIVPRVIPELPPFACEPLDVHMFIPGPNYRGMFSLRLCLREGMLEFPFLVDLSSVGE